ncbi:helicase carboxy-terminal domain protein (macronuclear) [Tetrahymena thermophila SB210]|uniref:Helicase carboxy-terminal domain protein n=1 Tax=Tetrahymena thermophila (strain SB210) TaxID=312017 RepID=Q22MV8_TETTS|nr:helicase carboxy-terminal domain protein [Tetrahymena thermophila SB210]EAR86656.1 helicase carboxy-terminal domain protein [Tetrahymena thermophila SB210]|eukprot:XP_976912.1 helicase carboxy-terminal domain protein [Tetrahymena thermophila SB210]
MFESQGNLGAFLSQKLFEFSNNCQILIKLLEGIDLSDSLAWCVLLVGVPLWYISEPQFICKKKYVELELKMDHTEWQRKQLIKCDNQAADRSIRHRYDQGYP